MLKTNSRLTKIILVAVLIAVLTSLCACGQAESSLPAPEEVSLNVGRVVIFETSSSSYDAADGVYALQDFLADKFSAMPEGVALIETSDGEKAVLSNADILACSVKADETSAVLTGKAVPKTLADKDLLYIAFEAEALLFVKTELAMPDIAAIFSMPTDCPYTFSSIDGFNWACLDAEDAMGSSLRPTESGSVDAAVPSIPEGGTARDCIYFVPGHTDGAASATVK